MLETPISHPRAESRHRPVRLIAAWLFVASLGSSLSASASPEITQDAGQKLVTLRDGDGQLTLRLNYRAGCILDRVYVRGREVIGDDGGVATGIRVGDQWFTTKTSARANVQVDKDTVTVSGIQFGRAGQSVKESWKFTALADRIVWRISRQYTADATVADMAFPVWNFSNRSAWTGGMLDNGGVIWNKYLDQTNATYGGHFGTITFWNAQSNDCLRITPRLPKGYFGAGRFSRLAPDELSFCYTVYAEPVQPAHGQSRFLGDRQDLWQALAVHPAEVAAEFELQSLNYDRTYDRGTFVGVNGHAIRELLNTVARYGVIDSQLVGGNGWRSGYICLHEPFFAEIAAALNAPDYTANLAAALDFERDRAITTNGRVKSRWCYGPWDAMPGTYDRSGFYEAQWGYLLDSQPDYVINVVEQFYLTGDRAWLAGQKDACERALEFLTRREVGDSGLVAMMTDSHLQQRGSDWIDIIWAAYENAFVNAQLYAALNLWAGAEETLGNPGKGQGYRAFAAQLKNSFNRPTSAGGFWDSTNHWYVYWRDRDGSIHGNNLVTPVNFAAIAYGLCNDPIRKKEILDRIEAEMRREGLFYWPLSFFPYAPDEGAGSNFPFPKYENGDIFLSWGELGVRAYAASDPALALKYVKNTLDRYDRDGLSFQRYLRSSQQGDGDDILAGNCLPIVGLYRDIYGIQPQPDRLYLDPHLPRELDGTTLRYQLRGRFYEIALATNASSITSGSCTVRDTQPFGVDVSNTRFDYFCGSRPDWALSVVPPRGARLTIQIDAWPDAPDSAHTWTESLSQGAAATISHNLKGFKPGATYQLAADGKVDQSFRADKTGQLAFALTLSSGRSAHFEVTPAP